ncbi:phosphatase 2C-like domain-containing protein [Gilbertella persicaria]|uniref:phosphatase 2C-like domain-containing protein n=1 Tax=Gilbertella persicaria TaxID=101096 RepID=UPI00221F32F6|nr:phosphatase 2C-like domain-containing protein [Gilbertella persicaria]KAI8081863.1 phosphatase 2C-like domain-containing protein [Gilbertella persicaria]
MKSKTWLTVSSTAKHWSHHQQSLLYQHSLPSVTSVRHLPTVVDPPTPSKPSPSIITTKKETARHLAYTTTPRYYPIYTHPKRWFEPHTRPSFVFAHGASGFAKRQRYTTPDTHKYNSQHYYSIQIGEDAYFRRSDALGVADGVGGWSGVSAANAALYSRKLMHHAYLELERLNTMEDADPVCILQKSYEESMQEAQKEGIIGSCTACLAILRHQELRIANIGDCGISVIRQNNYIFRTEEQQHAFNFPYQLGTSSPDRPNDAQSFTVAVEKGDIIIMGSDGLFDNLFDKEILSIVRSLKRSEPQKISDALAERAKTVSHSKLNIDSPFGKRAVNEGLYYKGGKLDDISVLVAIVKDG